MTKRCERPLAALIDQATFTLLHPLFGAWSLVHPSRVVSSPLALCSSTLPSRLPSPHSDRSCVTWQPRACPTSHALSGCRRYSLGRAILSRCVMPRSRSQRAASQQPSSHLGAASVSGSSQPPTRPSSSARGQAAACDGAVMDGATARPLVASTTKGGQSRARDSTYPGLARRG
jgi:hypothetical protein